MIALDASCMIKKTFVLYIHIGEGSSIVYCKILRIKSVVKTSYHISNKLDKIVHILV